MHPGKHPWIQFGMRYRKAVTEGIIDGIFEGMSEGMSEALMTETMTGTSADSASPASSDTHERPAKKLSRALTQRLARYRECVATALKQGKPTLSSESMGKDLKIDSTVVRKDMAALGVIGKPHVGYFVPEIVAGLDRHIEEQHLRAAVLVGAGNMGFALVRSGALERHGVHLEAVFDRDAKRVGTVIGRHTIEPMDAFEERTKQCGARLGVVIVPSKSAQSIVDRMAAAGIKVIWNFAPVPVKVPPGIRVLNEQLTDSVSRLARYLDNTHPVTVLLEAMSATAGLANLVGPDSSPEPMAADCPTGPVGEGSVGAGTDS
ncbi:MAG: redox-sensing transcriptional repressor Rex [Polyangiaceae bacterium]|nr:redox-sensing transcriptional repressor Rex [Polyangiaceae bacterium]